MCSSAILASCDCSSSAFDPVKRFLYEYNFFDEWRLDVRFEGEKPQDPHRRYPYCVAGAQRAPKEDCGGPVPFMERWQRASAYERAAYARDTVIKLSALIEDTRLDARACREQALVMLKRHAPASFDRTSVNRRLGLYADGNRWEEICTSACKS
jgi:hypothetical protein